MKTVCRACHARGTSLSFARISRGAPSSWRSIRARWHTQERLLSRGWTLLWTSPRLDEESIDIFHSLDLKALHGAVCMKSCGK
mmetsp:Transcript_14138/g.23245  ORF Transcript_14138/g.23245 Transcript_14138/m.23245 type:complete len:83 (+) Transcript_14138:269-517(+)